MCIRDSHSETHGNVLMLDGCFMFTERDCHCYHDKCNELMTRKKYFQDILIIGGGDFGLVKKLSYRKDIRSITIIEIDKEVISSCRKFFPEFFKISQNFMKKIKISEKENNPEFFIKYSPISFPILSLPPSITLWQEIAFIL